MIQYFLMIQFSLFVVFDGSFCREAMPSHFKFKEYCPIVFRNLRERFGIDDHDYMVNIISDIDAITYIDRGYTNRKIPSRNDGGINRR